MPSLTFQKKKGKPERTTSSKAGISFKESNKETFTKL
jgi:hypothetical protein